MYHQAGLFGNTIIAFDSNCLTGSCTQYMGQTLHVHWQVVSPFIDKSCSHPKPLAEPNSTKWYSSQIQWFNLNTYIRTSRQHLEGTKGAVHDTIAKRIRRETPDTYWTEQEQEEIHTHTQKIYIFNLINGTVVCFHTVSSCRCWRLRTLTDTSSRFAHRHSI